MNRRSQHCAAGMRHHGRRQIPGGPTQGVKRKNLLHLPAVNAVDIEGANAGARRFHRLGCVARRQARLQLRFQQMDECTHVVNGAVAEERH